MPMSEVRIVLQLPDLAPRLTRVCPQDDTYLAMGLCAVMFLVSLLMMDQCKKRRGGQTLDSRANRVQQDRTARPDGSGIINHTGEQKAHNNQGAYRAVSYEHNNPTHGRGKSQGGTGNVSVGSTPDFA
jgi:hypothetical protein